MQIQSIMYYNLVISVSIIVESVDFVNWSNQKMNISKPGGRENLLVFQNLKTDFFFLDMHKSKNPENSSIFIFCQINVSVLGRHTTNEKKRQQMSVVCEK